MNTAHGPRAALTLTNQGSETCPISGVAFDLGTDSAFRLDTEQALDFRVDPGATRPLVVRFSAFDSSPPHLKTGTLSFRTGSVQMPEVSVPLAAYVNLTCVESSEWIYTIRGVEALMAKTVALENPILGAGMGLDGPRNRQPGRGSWWPSCWRCSG